MASVLDSEKKAHGQVIHETNLEADEIKTTTQWVPKEINNRLKHLGGISEQKRVEKEQNKQKPC
mgnify:CR=1 FL=1